MLINLIDRANIGMVQCGSGLGLALKSSQSLRISGNVVGQEFQRNKAAEFEVLRLIHDAHAAAA